MSYDLHKQYLATHKDKLEQHITDVNIPKSEAEWWACDEITRLRAENEKLRELVKAAYYEAYRHRHMAGDGGTDDPEDICAWRLSAARKVLGEKKDNNFTER